MVNYSMASLGALRKAGMDGDIDFLRESVAIMAEALYSVTPPNHLGLNGIEAESSGSLLRACRESLWRILPVGSRGRRRLLHPYEASSANRLRTPLTEILSQVLQPVDYVCLGDVRKMSGQAADIRDDLGPSLVEREAPWFPGSHIATRTITALPKEHQIPLPT